MLDSPSEQLGIILMTSSKLKTSVVEYHKAKEELVAMDDELPLIIYIVSQCRVDNLTSKVNMLEDYVRFIEDFESEQRLITNIKVKLFNFLFKFVHSCFHVHFNFYLHIYCVFRFRYNI